MKKMFDSKNRFFGKKNFLLAVVAILLVVLTAVGSTVSWIEEVSQVEFDNTKGQQTPSVIGNKILESDMITRLKTGNEENEIQTIDLAKYFNLSGGAHLSPCYGDGDHFYFPVDGDPSHFREGTKDDANVNYLSATFKVRSIGADSVYWFAAPTVSHGGNLDYVTFNENQAALRQYLRISITVDGSTNVYSLKNGNTINTSYRTVVSDNVTTQTGRSVEQYAYYDEEFNTDQTCISGGVNVKDNMGVDNENLNGNTLFTVNTYNAANKAATVKTVTVKIWLECPATGTISTVDIADLNINLVSAWAKTRRIYVKDETVNQAGYTQEKWLSHNGTADNTAGLFWILKNSNNSVYWKLTRIKNAQNQDTQFYYVDVPAIYNNAEVRLSRRNSTTWNGSSEWDGWDTTFPDTFHSETFTVYTSTFGTWNEYANYVYFVNSCDSTTGFDDRTPCAYMWADSSVHGSGMDDKVVKNANWTGIELTKLNNKVTGKNIDMDLYVFYYNALYDRIIFNDNYGNKADRYQYQTQDLWLSGDDLTATGQMKKPYFDMATLKWYSSVSDLPKYSNVYLKSNMRGGDLDLETRFAYDKDGDGSTKYCYVYIKSDQTSTNDNHFTFTIWDGDNSTEYKCHKDSGNLVLGTEYNLGTNSDFNKSFSLYKINRGLYKFTYLPGEKIKVECVDDMQAS